MIAAARGEEFHIPFGGAMQFQFSADAGEAFVRASEADVPGASVHNLDGPVLSVPDVIAAIEEVVPDARITAEETPLPFPSSVDSTSFEALVGGPTARPFDQGVADAIEAFRRLG
jgi:nucleoside-diphosphate-sugar epimerase